MLGNRDAARWWSVRLDQDTEEWEVFSEDDVYASCELKARAERIARSLNRTRPSECEPEEALNKTAGALEEIIGRCKKREGCRDLIRLARNGLKFVAPSKSTERNRAKRGADG